MPAQRKSTARKPKDEKEIDVLTDCWASLKALSKPAQKRTLEFLVAKTEEGSHVEWRNWR